MGNPEDEVQLVGSITYGSDEDRELRDAFRKMRDAAPEGEMRRALTRVVAGQLSLVDFLSMPSLAADWEEASRRVQELPPETWDIPADDEVPPADAPDAEKARRTAPAGHHFG